MIAGMPGTGAFRFNMGLPLVAVAFAIGCGGTETGSTAGTSGSTGGALGSTGGGGGTQGGGGGTNGGGETNGGAAGSSGRSATGGTGMGRGPVHGRLQVFPQPRLRRSVDRAASLRTPSVQGRRRL